MKSKAPAGMFLTSIIKTYCYPLLPTRYQHQQLEDINGLQCDLYNAALQERIDAYKKAGENINYFQQSQSLTQIRADDLEGYGSLPTTLSRATLKRLAAAYNSFFQRLKMGKKPGFPRYKGKSRWNSFGFSEFSGIVLEGDKIKFQGISGGLRVHLYRPLPIGEKILACQFKKTAKGWTVSFQVRESLLAPMHTGPAVGIDVGITQFAVISDGSIIPSSGATKRYASKLKRAQRKLARAKKGSKSRYKKKQMVAKVHMKIANVRDNFLHQASARITKQYSLIGLEDLNIQNMARSASGTLDKPGTKVKQKSGLNRNIMDAGWGKFKNMIRYKAEWVGGRVIMVNPQHTSQVCSKCGEMVRKELSERVHDCVCGLKIDRDLNAASNILKLALGTGAGDSSKSKIVLKLSKTNKAGAYNSKHRAASLIPGRSGSGLVVSRGSKARLPAGTSDVLSN